MFHVEHFYRPSPFVCSLAHFEQREQSISTLKTEKLLCQTSMETRRAGLHRPSRHASACFRDFSQDRLWAPHGNVPRGTSGKATDPEFIHEFWPVRAWGQKSGRRHADPCRPSAFSGPCSPPSPAPRPWSAPAPRLTPLRGFIIEHVILFFLISSSIQTKYIHFVMNYLIYSIHIVKEMYIKHSSKTI